MACIYSSKTQVYWTCKALLEGRTISHKTEIREVNGWRLGAIIHVLRKKHKWPTKVEYRGSENIAYYRLDSNCNKNALTFPHSAKDLKQELGL